MGHGTPVPCSPIGGTQAAEEQQSQADYPSPGDEQAARDDVGLQAQPVEWSSTAFSVQTGDDEAKAIASLAETFQTAIDAVNRRYDALDIWKHPQIGPLLMQVVRGIDRIRAELRSERSTERAMPRILVVDDMQDVLVTVGAFLVKEGYSIVKASNGEEALQAILGDPGIGLLISDLVMPGMNGAELVAQATELRPHLRAMLITAYPNADGIADIASLATILPKPFRRDVLITAVRNLLDGAARPENDGPSLVCGSSPAVERSISKSSKVAQRPAIDCIADGMWRLGAGAGCAEDWDRLPEHQRAWWRDCARAAVAGWTAEWGVSYSHDH